jgi:hypothetical protein
LDGNGTFPVACYVECSDTVKFADTIHGEDGRWSAEFTNVPPCDHSGKLTVRGVNIHTGELSEDSVRGLEVTGERQDAITRDEPPPFSTVAHTFTADGRLGSGTNRATGCYFMCNIGPLVQATAIRNPPVTPAGHWAADFTVPSCSSASVTVIGDDRTSDTHTNITVS